MKEGKILESWKEIAAHLKRNIRTCQLWERNLGLPVHRLDGSPKAHVFAYEDELDGWLDEKLHEKEGLSRRAPVSRLRRRTRFLFAFMLVLALTLIGVAIVRLISPPKALNSIAILPMINESGDPDKDFFANSLTTLIISELYKVAALNVTPPDSVRLYKDSNKNPAEIARELEVQAVVRASLLPIGNKIRLTVTLSDPFKKRILWADTLESEEEDILVLQSGLCEALISKIRVAITPAEKARMARARKIHPDAYEAYMTGIHFISQVTAEALDKSKEEFERSLSLDPNFAPAYAGLAEACILSAMSHGSLLPRVAFPQAREAAKRALKIDGNFASAHVSSALCEIFHYWDWPAAREFLEHAIELEPNNAKAHETYCLYLVIMERKEEALREIKLARKLDPRSMIINSDLGVTYQWAGQYDLAIDQLRRTLELNPDFPPARWGLGETYRRQGLYMEAVQEFEKAYSASGRHCSWLNVLGLAYAQAGLREKALLTLDQMKTLYRDKRNISLTFIAAIHEALGDREEAFLWFQRSVEERDPQASFYKFYDMFTSLRSEPRFQALASRMNLELPPP